MANNLPNYFPTSFTDEDTANLEFQNKQLQTYATSYDKNFGEQKQTNLLQEYLRSYALFGGIATVIGSALPGDNPDPFAFISQSAAEVLVENTQSKVQNLTRNALAVNLSSIVTQNITMLAAIGDAVGSMEELFELAPILNKVEWTPEELAWIQGQIDDIPNKSAAQLKLEADEYYDTEPTFGTPEEEQDYLDYLTASNTRTYETVTTGLTYTRSVDAMVAALRSSFEADTATLPESAESAESILNYLNSLVPTPEGYEAEELTLRETLAQIGADMAEEFAEIDKITEIPPASVMRYITAPLLGALQFFSAYNELVARPLAYYGYTGIAKLPFVSLSENEKDMVASYNTFIDNGKIGWDAASAAYEGWEAPWYKKLAVEIFFDPLTYIGIGIIPRTIGRLPVVGRFFSKLDNFFAETMNAPIDYLLKKKAAMAKLPQQVARVEAHDAMISAHQVVQEVYGTAARKLDPKKFITLLRDVAKGKTITAGGRVLAKYLVPTSVPDEALVARLSDAVGGLLKAEDVTPDVLERVYARIEDIIYRGKVNADEAIDNLVHELGGNPGKANTSKITAFIKEAYDDSATTLIDGLEKLVKTGKVGTGDLVAILGDKVKAESLALLTNASRSGAVPIAKVAGIRMERASSMGMVTNKLNGFLLNKFARNLEGFNTFMAKAYLGFSGYFGFNIMENIARSLIGGVVPFGISRRGLSVKQISALEFLDKHGHWRNMVINALEDAGDVAGQFGAKKLVRPTIQTTRERLTVLAKDIVTGQFWVKKSNELGAIHRHYFFDQKWTDHFVDLVGQNPTLRKEFERIMGSVDNLTINHTIKAKFKKELIHAFSNPNPEAALDNVLASLDEVNLKIKPLSNVVSMNGDKCVSSALLHERIADGVLMKDIAKSIDDAIEMELQDVAFSSVMIKEQFAQVRQELATVSIKTTEDYYRVINTLRNMNQGFKEFPGQILEHSQMLASRMTHAKDKATLWGRVLKDLDSAMVEAGATIDDMTKLLNAQTDTLFKGKLGAAMKQSMDNIAVEAQAYRTFNRNLATYRTQFFAGKQGVKMTSEQWNEFYGGMNAMYEAFRPVKTALAESETATRIISARATAAERRASMSPKQGVDYSTQSTLSAQDLANITAVHPNSVTAAVMNNAYLQSEDSFLGIVRAYVKANGHTATDAQIRQGYKDLWGAVGIKNPKLMNEFNQRVAALRTMEVEFNMIKQANMMNKVERGNVTALIDDVKLSWKTGGFAGLSRDLGQEAADLATRDFTRMFPVYTNDTAFDATMRSIYPYWNYEWQRPLWIARIGMTRPGSAPMWAEYMEYTENGYMRIGNTNLELNPFRGTVAMGGGWSLFQDFPEYDEQFPIAGKLMDWTQRVGFFPNASIQIAWLLGQGKLFGDDTQSYSLLPTAVKSLWSIAEQIPYLGDWASRLRSQYGDRFYQYQITAVASDLAQIKKLPYTGVDIWNLVEDRTIRPFDEFWKKQQVGILTSDDEEAVAKAQKLLEMNEIWEQATKNMASYSLLIEQTSAMRIYPKNRDAARLEYQLVIQQITGLTPMEQHEAQRKGYTISQIMGRGFTPAEREMVDQLDYRIYWAGVTTPLRPESQQLYFRTLREFYMGYENVRTRLSQDKVALDKEFFAGILTVEEWRARTKEIESQEKNAWATLTSASDIYLPESLTERAAYYATLGIPEYGNFDDMPRDAAMYQLQDAYFQIEPKTVYDLTEEGNVFKRVDYVGMSYLKGLIDATAKDWGVADEWQQLKTSQYATPLDILERDVTEKYMGTYWDLSDIIRNAYFTTKEQDVINQILRGELVAPEGSLAKELYAKFSSMLRNAREKLRQSLPVLDYWLYFFGYTTTFKSAQSQELWNTVGRDFTKWSDYKDFWEKYPTG